MRLSPKLLSLAAYALAALLAFLAATWAATVIETRSALAVRKALVEAGHVWADAGADGLQVIISGTAPTESQRFRALAVAGEVIDPGRVIDGMAVDDPDAMKAPDYSVEILRNADGVSLIGLVPAATDRARLVAELRALAGAGTVTDMLDTANHPVPETWDAALDFAIDALGRLPKSKISVSADRIAVTAISDSAAEKARLEADLAREVPNDLALVLDISAPRPVIAPFTLRFLASAEGAHFDACSADTERARDLILSAATAAGAEGKLSCTIGLGVPSPDWSQAAVLAIKAAGDLGAASVTMTDADVALVAAPGVDPATFDRVVGELESGLPDVFSLDAVLTPKPDADTPAQLREFTAVLDAEGRVTLRGRINDERTRAAVENVARVAFGGPAVTAAMRLDDGLPTGWPVRVLSAVEALAELNEGTVVVRPDIVRIEGVSGSSTTGETITRNMAAKLGGTQGLEISIRYDRKLDPLLGLPTAEECVTNLNTVLAAQKISFEPGAATISAEAAGTLDKLAAAMKNCADFPMEIGGHTDSQGREEMNLSLSQDRAQAVINALMERRTLVGNLTAMGYGETVPLADNDTEAGREANRRIEVRLIEAETTATPSAGTDTATGTEAAAIPVVVETPGEDTMRPKERPEQ